MPKPPLRLQTTTLWDYPSQNYGGGSQGDTSYRGATPSYVLWNLLQRFTRPGDLVVDPMAGSGTTLDVARECKRRALGYDIEPFRKDIFRADARRLPLEDAKADFVFVDPPYSDHLEYSKNPHCIGRLDAAGSEYWEALRQVVTEVDRVLRPGRYLAFYVSDSFQKARPLVPIGVRLFLLLEERFVPVDHIAVVRHNATLKRNHWHTAAIEGNYHLRGFNHLMVFFKRGPGRETSLPDRRLPEEVLAHLEARRSHRA